MRQPIYLDYNATTPVDERVFEAMLPYLRDHFGNASSKAHVYGRDAGEAVERARQQLATFVSARTDEVIFTSGATESNNLALKGIIGRWKKLTAPKLITAANEHPAVLETAQALERRGVRLAILPVNSAGAVDPDQVANAIDDATALVSIMVVNNEVGSINPITEISAICRERDVPLHCDAVQAAGKIPFSVAELGVDLASLTAHKMYGPKGVGALYVRRRRPKLRLEPLFDGGGQEQSIRPGTLNVAGIVGFGAAAEVARESIDEEVARLGALRDQLEESFIALGSATINGSAGARVPGTSSVSFAGVESEPLLLALSDLALSSGSACSSGSGKISHVLEAMGIDEAIAHGTLRISLGRQTTAEQLEHAAARIAVEVAKLRALSPSFSQRATENL